MAYFFGSPCRVHYPTQTDPCAVQVCLSLLFFTPTDEGNQPSVALSSNSTWPVTSHHITCVMCRPGLISQQARRQLSPFSLQTSGRQLYWMRHCIPPSKWPTLYRVGR